MMQATMLPFKQKGFSLVEVLVTLVIFTVGLLGIIKLQLVGLNLASDSYYRTVAAIQANDMIDRMRANHAETSLGTGSAYNNNATGVSHSSCYDTTGCSVKELAEQDLYEWSQNIAAKLPSGKGIVCIDSTPTDGNNNNFQCDNVINNSTAPIFAIKIIWYERKNSGASQGGYHQYSVSFSL